MFPHPSFTDVLFFCHGTLGRSELGRASEATSLHAFRDSSVQHASLLGCMMSKQGKDNSVSKETERRCFHLSSIKFRMLVISAGLELIT